MREDIGPTTRWTCLKGFHLINVNVIIRAKNISGTKKGIRFDIGDATEEIPADTIIISPEMEPLNKLNKLYESLENNLKECYLIGDAKEARKAIDAICEEA